jgi:hypothetical protein
LWPGHAKPMPDELLTSWFVRLASANGLSTRNFAKCAFGGPIWSRDLDLEAQPSLLESLAVGAHVTPLQAWSTTLQPLRAKFSDDPHSLDSSWIMRLSRGPGSRLRFGLQACIACLDEEQHFDRAWRLAFVTCCSKHRVRLIDRCASCNGPLRIWQRRESALQLRLARHCFACGTALRCSPSPASPSAMDIQETLLRALRAENVLLSGVSYSISSFFRELRKFSMDRRKHRLTFGMSLHCCTKAVDDLSYAGRLALVQRLSQALEYSSLAYEPDVAEGIE